MFLTNVASTTTTTTTKTLLAAAFIPEWRPFISRHYTPTLLL